MKCLIKNDKGWVVAKLSPDSGKSCSESSRPSVDDVAHDLFNVAVGIFSLIIPKNANKKSISKDHEKLFLESDAQIMPKDDNIYGDIIETLFLCCKMGSVALPYMIIREDKIYGGHYCDTIYLL
jgi:hypothetical protein